MMKRLYVFFCLLGCFLGFIHSQSETFKIYHTTDIHGNFFPIDFINNKEGKGSFARVSTYINEQRVLFPDRTLLLDGGDLLQGQPCVYYSNFIDVHSTHLCAQVMNYIGYDAAAMGNHDIETGHGVYDRWLKDCGFPVLGANIMDTKTGKSYIPAYQLYEKGGVKIAVVGMITKAIPAWLPENLWEGLRFDDIQEVSLQLIPEIKKKENPDIVIGLFHTGVHSSEVAGFKDNVGLEVAQKTFGYDVIFCGHDHSVFCQKVINSEGESVLVINPANGGYKISNVTVQVDKKDGKVISKIIDGEVVDISGIEPDKAYMDHFAGAIQKTKDYVDAEIGVFTKTISSRDAWFGPSAFVDLLHSLQLKLTGAEVSLVAPLSQDAVISEGKIYMRDMFNLYKYENLLYTMELSGKELKNALEFSYGLWVNRMKSENDHLLLLKFNQERESYSFVNPSYSFDSAAGMIYTVNVTKPTGERLTILSMADGTPFDESKIYRVAVNSYQGSGGGSILTDGAGIAKEKLHERIVYSTDKDLRYYLAEEIKSLGTLSPEPLNQWKFIPEEWAKPAAERDYKLLYGGN